MRENACWQARVRGRGAGCGACVAVRVWCLGRHGGIAGGGPGMRCCSLSWRMSSRRVLRTTRGLWCLYDGRVVALSCSRRIRRLRARHRWCSLRGSSLEGGCGAKVMKVMPGMDTEVTLMFRRRMPGPHRPPSVTRANARSSTATAAAPRDGDMRPLQYTVAAWQLK